MSANNTNNNNQFVAFQDVNEQYAWVNYGQFKLLMMKRNGYVNVTKMCDEGDKHFFNWKKNSRSKELIKYITDELESDPMVTIMTGENDLRGTYAHPDLIIHIAMWISPSFCIYVTNIVNAWRKLSIENEISYWTNMKNCINDTYNNKYIEKLVRDKLSETLNGKVEILCDNGYIDIVTNDEIIEVKHIDNWKHALGQILSYKIDDNFEKHKTRLHLYNETIICENNKNQIIKTCNKYNCDVTFEII